LELKEFIAEAITQITAGITEAQGNLRSEWVRINPKPGKGFPFAAPMLYRAENGAGVFPLTFDVAVSAEDKRGGGGVGITVMGFGMNVERGSAESTSSVSRVTFTIPVAYPLKDLSKGEPRTTPKRSVG
jgi:hypothetical protein